MKAVILAGGQGTRLREETEYRPKPMVHIGNKPILWHIMKILYSHGITDFEIALGFKGEHIKEFFLNYPNLIGDIQVCYKRDGQEISIDSGPVENWNIGLNDTGLHTNTGGRLFLLRDKLKDTFLCTYGDGVANIDINELLKFHEMHGKIATVTGVRPSARFGSLEINENSEVISFAEKPASNQWVNGGFFIFSPKVFDYLSFDSILERDPLESLSRDGELMAWKHEGFWHPMDTIRDAQHLNDIWNNGEALWKTW